MLKEIKKERRRMHNDVMLLNSTPWFVPGSVVQSNILKDMNASSNFSICFPYHDVNQYTTLSGHHIRHKSK